MTALRCKPEFFVIVNSQGLLPGLNGSNHGKKLVRCPPKLNGKAIPCWHSRFQDLKDFESLSCSYSHIFGEFMVTLSHIRTLCLVVLGASAVLALSGCSISDSVGSISDSAGSIAKSSGSISNSSASSNKSSEKDKKTYDNRYENEIQDFTVTYLRTNSSQADQNSFMEGISDVASQNGIVDWEANPKTYRAIGKGLKKAKISGIQYDSYKKKFSNGDSGKMDDIQEGYDN
jgi:hypothetical protein